MLFPAEEDIATNMILYTDGGCSNNQKEPKDRLMRIVVVDETGAPLVEKSRAGGSNNIAELWAVAEALFVAKRSGGTAVHVFTDSKNNLAWLDGKVGKKLNDRSAVTDLLEAITNLRRRIAVTVTWIPRDRNLAGLFIEQNAPGSAISKISPV